MNTIVGSQNDTAKITQTGIPIMLRTFFCSYEGALAIYIYMCERGKERERRCSQTQRFSLTLKTEPKMRKAYQA